MERLQKVLAAAGFGSRRRCEDLIREGRVAVNGAPATLGMSVDPTTDEVLVDGRPATGRALRKRVYLMLNKPRGYVSTVRDEAGRPTVMDLVRSVPERIFPVGRLDRDTEGLLLLTNDGDLAYALTHPRHRVDKVYVARVEGGTPSEAALTLLREGVDLDEGRTAPARARVLEDGRVQLILREGRKHQVRRMLAAVGHPVLELMRVRVGSLKLGALPLGSFRHLMRREVEDLWKAAEGPGEGARNAARRPGSRRGASEGPREKPIS